MPQFSERMVKISSMFKFFFLAFSFLFAFSELKAQNGRQVSGTVKDSTGITLPGVNVKLISPLDSAFTTTDPQGRFVFNGVKSNQFSITFQSVGYTPLRRRFNLNKDNLPAILAPVVLSGSITNLKNVIVEETIPIKIKEDTVEYAAEAYKVRENAPVEDVLRKLPGLDVDQNGNITAQGKSITKVRVNGKDFFGGDVQTATKNLPADMVQSYQIIDDYGDQANLTGIKTGEPDKILNINIKPSRNYGYFGQVTVGDGMDDIPQMDGTVQKNRFIAGVNAFRFKGTRQIALLSNFNNTNTNLFNFGSGPGGGGGGGRGLGLGRGGGGGGGSGSNQNGVQTARAIGLNYRDAWGKKITVYGSLSLADNSTNTISSSIQNNISIGNTSLNTNSTNETDQKKNIRFTYNLEYKPDTVNYLKVIPTFSFGSVQTGQSGASNLTNNGNIVSDYTVISNAQNSNPSYGLNALFNHRFKGFGRNFSINVGAGTYHSYSLQNPIYTFVAGRPNAPANQSIRTTSKTDSIGTNISYIEPILSKGHFLEFNYGFHTAHTQTEKTTDTLTQTGQSNFYGLLSNNYTFDFTVNRFGLNFRSVQKKYNYTLGIAFQPTLLNGNFDSTGIIRNTRVTTFNIAPTLRFIYNFSRNQLLSLNYNGGSEQPSFSVLQPVIDFSNASFPVQGNPDLKPSFTNNFSIRYNKFDIATGKVFFSNISFNSISNNIVSNSINYPRFYPPNPQLAGTILTKYLNANGFYSVSGFYIFSKPWEKRKYTLILNGNINYSNNISFITNFDSISRQLITEQNTNKNLVISQRLRFRYDITDKVDAELNSSYSLNHATNTIPQNNLNNNFQTFSFGITGKNYILKDWTLSYDFTKSLYINYIGSTNPSIFNAYLERRFLKNNVATLRMSIFDIFNQNTGYSSTQSGTSTIQTNTNRLGRYYLLSFTLRLQKFAGRRPEGPMNFPGRGRPGGDFGRPPGD